MVIYEWRHLRDCADICKGLRVLCASDHTNLQRCVIDFELICSYRMGHFGDHRVLFADGEPVTKPENEL